MTYAHADAREQARLAAENPGKLRVLRELAERHAGDRLLVLGTYLESLHVQKRFWHQLRRRRRRWHKRNMFPNLFEFLNNFGPLRCYNFESTFCDDSERVRVCYFERESVYFLLPVC